MDKAGGSAQPLTEPGQGFAAARLPVVPLMMHTGIVRFSVRHRLLLLAIVLTGCSESLLPGATGHTGTVPGVTTPTTPTGSTSGTCATTTWSTVDIACGDTTCTPGHFCKVYDWYWGPNYSCLPVPVDCCGPSDLVCMEAHCASLMDPYLDNSWSYSDSPEPVCTISSGYV